MDVMHNPIAHALSSLTLGDPATLENITMFPLVGKSPAEQEPSYLTLDEALARSTTEITEVSEQGSVPELRVVNKAAQPVFILDGEELLGAKQNRVVNLTILVAAASTLNIPVSLVEAGRWRARSRGFTAAPRTQYTAGRAMRMAQVTESIRTDGKRRSDQSEVWANISAKSERLGASSATGAMEEIFAVHSDFTDRCVQRLGAVEGQCGALFLINGQVMGFDLFDRAPTLRSLLPKLVRSVAVEALDRPADGRSAALQGCQASARQFLAVVAATKPHVTPAVGLGEDYRLVAPGFAGAALVHEGAAVHVSAFTLE